MGKIDGYPYVASVFIGRFQPFHKGHLNSVKLALKQSEKLIIILGSYRMSPSLRAPWSAGERMEMIKACLTSSQLKRIHFVQVRDRLYCEEMWINNIKGEVFKITGSKVPVAIIGHEKDSSSYYLKIFPHWKFLETGNYEGINATEIRKKFFLSKHLESAYEKTPKQIVIWLKKYRKSIYFKKLKTKFLYVDKFLKNEGSLLPHEICNSIIFCCGYILFVRSKNPLSKDLLSLPEAKPAQKEGHKKCSIRGLLEETKISMSFEKIEASFQREGEFNFPGRFPLCKQTSYTFFYKLNETFLPEVSQGKGVESVEWILLDDVYLLENQIYSDHFQIIQWFLGNKIL
jgi:bifunctional NMN adenylyltransferase/nudix hydrolase